MDGTYERRIRGVGLLLAFTMVFMGLVRIVIPLRVPHGQFACTGIGRD